MRFIVHPPWRRRIWMEPSVKVDVLHESSGVWSHHEIPDEVIKAAQLVSTWMNANNAVEMLGLRKRIVSLPSDTTGDEGHSLMATHTIEVEVADENQARLIEIALRDPICRASMIVFALLKPLDDRSRHRIVTYVQDFLVSTESET